MKNFKIYYFLIIAVIIATSCTKDEDIDKTEPVIDLNFSEAFPVNCDTIYFGESFTFKALFTDNIQLGSYSIDIHNNFDHHSHTTEVTECELDPVKEAINPFVTIEDYDIPEGQNEYLTDISVTIPSGNSDGEYDEGDYHFFISLTDHEGWSSQKGLSIKMLHRY